MKLNTSAGLFILAIATASFFVNACNKEDSGPAFPPGKETTPLYDTLGWFIQGAQGPVEGNGTKMIADPDNAGKKIQAGRLAIRTVVNKALMVIAGDEKLAKYFPTLLSEVGDGNTTGLARLLETFTDFVQQAASGQKIYKGKSMKDAHNHATHSRFGSEETPTADSASFDQFMADVVEAAQSLDVPASVIGQLGAALAATEGDVVQDKTPALATTPLYDTLGWFIQGAKGEVEGNGTKMVDDPDNEGQKIQAGRLAIRTVVNEALMVIAGDEKLAKYFPTLLSEVGAGNTTGYSRLLETFSDFVQQAASGQEIYKGKSMKDAHNHATHSRFGSEETPTADSASFDQFMTDVVKAASNLKVPASVTAQLGTALVSVEGDVVQDKD